MRVGQAKRGKQSKRLTLTQRILHLEAILEYMLDPHRKLTKTDSNALGKRIRELGPKDWFV